MDPTTSRIKELAIGDLVTHILYGKEWVGVVIAFKVVDDSPRGEKTLVKIQPGTKYENFFAKSVSKKDRVNDSLGYVTSNWLFKLEVKK
tara:strand:+ start:932 stop:1198 length:267 start_codon:yes stop_codon:yes gene_type:complete